MACAGKILYIIIVSRARPVATQRAREQTFHATIAVEANKVPIPGWLPAEQPAIRMHPLTGRFLRARDTGLHDCSLSKKMIYILYVEMLWSLPNYTHIYI